MHRFHKYKYVYVKIHSILIIGIESFSQTRLEDEPRMPLRVRCRWIMPRKIVQRDREWNFSNKWINPWIRIFIFILHRIIFIFYHKSFIFYSFLCIHCFCFFYHYQKISPHAIKLYGRFLHFFFMFDTTPSHLSYNFSFLSVDQNFESTNVRGVTKYWHIHARASRSVGVVLTGVVFSCKSVEKFEKKT